MNDGLRVLVADDHEVVRRGLVEMLSDEYPYASFGQAADSGEALELACQGGWDLLVMDLSMPGRGGLEVLADLHKLVPRLPVLILSMHPETEYAVRSLRAGASGYVHKGSVSAELLHAVRKVLTGNRYISPELAELLASDLGKLKQRTPHETLSDREYEVMKHIATGLSVKEIAAKLGLSDKTVFTYRSRMLEKLGLSGDVEVARYALQHKLVD